MDEPRPVIEYFDGQLTPPGPSAVDIFIACVLFVPAVGFGCLAIIPVILVCMSPWNGDMWMCLVAGLAVNGAIAYSLGWAAMKSLKRRNELWRRWVAVDGKVCLGCGRMLRDQKEACSQCGLKRSKRFWNEGEHPEPD